MIVGLLEHSKIDENKIYDIGYEYVERVNQYIALDGLTADGLKERLGLAAEVGYPYVVITTAGCVTMGQLLELVEECREDIVKIQIPVLVENGLAGDDISGYSYNDFSDISAIKSLVERCNAICEENLFAICINVGYLNLLATNVRVEMLAAGEFLQVIHVNDNDGFHNYRQMPYTFTRGRGDNTTDWVHFLAAVIKLEFDGILIYDTVGLFNRTPAKLLESMLSLLYSIASYWNAIIHFDDLLASKKNIILFGAGRMSSNFLNTWGDRFTPLFLVDNNESRWGSLHKGLEIKNPQAILEIPEEDRLVLICNMHYEEIGLQLRKMGVSYVKYNDNFYDFVVQ